MHSGKSKHGPATLLPSLFARSYQAAQASQYIRAWQVCAEGADEHEQSKHHQSAGKEYGGAGTMSIIIGMLGGAAVFFLGVAIYIWVTERL